VTAPTPTASAPATPAAPGRSSRRWWVLVVLGLAQLMLVLDLTVVNIALPSAQKALNFSNADRQWIVTAYALTFGGLLLFGGRLGDLVGRKRIFLIGIAGFAIVSAIGGASTGFAMLATARAAQGCFGAILAPTALSLLTTTFTDPKERNEAFGIFGAIAGAGGAVGLLLGGVLTEYLDWRWCLYVNIIFAVAAGIGAIVFLHDDRRSGSASLDLPGTLFSIAGLVALVYGFSEADTKGWSSPITIGLLIASVGLLALFTWWQTRAAHPLLPLRIVADRGRGGANLAVVLVGIAMFGVFLFLTYYLQEILGYSPVMTGAAFLPMLGMVMVTATSSGMLLLRRTGPRPLIVGGMIVAGVGMILMARLTVASTYVGHVLPSLLVVGLGMGFIFGAAMNVATAGADPVDAGVASALPNVAQQVGGALGPALLNTIATSAATSYLAGRALSPHVQALASVHGDRTAFTVVYIILFASAVISFFVLPRGAVAIAEGPPALG
jgi:EmrB/QacA subfamily drug resistance transporter